MAATDAQKRYWRTPKGKAMKSAADARYYERNKEQIKARELAKYHELTPEERTARSRQMIAREDPAMRRERKRVDQARVKLDVILGYGGVCVCCGADYMPHLTLDHVNGGGTAHRKVENARTLYRRLRRALMEGLPRDPEFQVLCWNCNWAKHTLGVCGCGGVI